MAVQLSFGRESSLTNVELPPGMAVDDYKLSLVVRIYDTKGAVVEHIIGVIEVGQKVREHHINGPTYITGKESSCFNLRCYSIHAIGIGRIRFIWSWSLVVMFSYNI